MTNRDYYEVVEGPGGDCCEGCSFSFESFVCKCPWFIAVHWACVEVDND